LERSESNRKRWRNDQENAKERAGEMPEER
jgi:hypothetical protein